VVEDKKSGTPKTYEGMTVGSGVLEKVQQLANHVAPLAPVEVHPTDEVKGKRFILVRIQRGDRAPYYVLNKPEIWRRTGNISDPLEQASREALDILFGLRANAASLRSAALKGAREVFDGALSQAEEERQAHYQAEYPKWVEVRKAEGHDHSPEAFKTAGVAYPYPLTKDDALAEVSLVPYEPTIPIVAPDKAMEEQQAYRVRITNEDFPSLNPSAMPDGYYTFDWYKQGGFIGSEQVTSYGLLYSLSDVSQRNTREFKGLRVYLNAVAQKLLAVVRSGRLFYEKYGYLGGVEVRVRLTNMKGAYVYRVTDLSHRPDLFGTELPQGLKSEYEWAEVWDASELYDEEKLRQKFKEFVRRMSWGVGHSVTHDNTLEAFLKASGLPNKNDQEAS
jgi:hypothetical protein